MLPNFCDQRDRRSYGRETTFADDGRAKELSVCNTRLLAVLLRCPVVIQSFQASSPFCSLDTGQTSQQQGFAQGDQTRPANDHHDSRQASPSDQMQATMSPVHQDNIKLVEGTAAAALIAWHEQSCLQIWWLLSGTVMVILNAVSLALNIKSMNSYSADQWRLVHVISFAVLCGYFGALSGQLYGMCLVRSVRLFAVHNKIAAPHCAGSLDLRSKVKVLQTSCAADESLAMALQWLQLCNHERVGLCAGLLFVGLHNVCVLWDHCNVVAGTGQARA